MATPNLNLNLPTVSVTLGPTWASNINTAFEVIDSHDHSSGKGARIPTAGLNINASLSFNSNSITSLTFSNFTNGTITPSGASFVRSLSVYAGDLYYTNNSGTAVQITSSGTLVSSPTSAQVVEPVGINGNLSINPSDTFVFVITDTTAPRSITLPLSGAVTAGRFYIVKDASGQSNTNNITIQTSGADTIDGASSAILNSNNESWMLIADGASSWYIA